MINRFELMAARLDLVRRENTLDQYDALALNEAADELRKRASVDPAWKPHEDGRQFIYFFDGIDRDPEQLRTHSVFEVCPINFEVLIDPRLDKTVGIRLFFDTLQPPPDWTPWNVQPTEEGTYVMGKWSDDKFRICGVGVAYFAKVNGKPNDFLSWNYVWNHFGSGFKWERMFYRKLDIGTPPPKSEGTT